MKNFFGLLYVATYMLFAILFVLVLCLGALAFYAFLASLVFGILMAIYIVLGHNLFLIVMVPLTVGGLIWQICSFRKKK